MKKQLLLFLFAMAFSLCGWCDEFTVGDFKYTTESGNTVSISKADNATLTGELIIPESVDYNGVTYSVSKISSNGFSNTDITSVVLPNTITSLSYESFYSCSNLETINLPTNLSDIGSYCFYYCPSLTSIESHIFFPFEFNNNILSSSALSKVKLYVPVGSLARYQQRSGWNKFANIVEEEMNDVNKEMFAYTQLGSGQVSVAASSKGIDGSITIPSTVGIDGTEYTVSEIASYGFENCEYLTSVTLPSTIKAIGWWAFAYTGIQSINLNEGLEDMGGWTFYSCKNLESITIPKTVTDFDWGVFSGDCNNLHEIKVEEGNSSLKTIDGMLLSMDGTVLKAYAFGYPTEHLSIPGTVTSLNRCALFNGNTKLKSIVVPSGVKYIGGDTFNGCTALTSLSLPDSITTIEYSAFRSCSALKSITIPTALSSISTSGVYSGCTALDSVIVRQNTPLEISASTFDDDTYTNATLYVPMNRAKYFKDATGWSKFTNIVEIKMDGLEASTSPYDNLEDNQMILGYYVSNNCATSDGTSYGGPRGGIYKACIGFSKDQITPFAGNKVKNVRFALTRIDDISGMKLWIGSTRDLEDLYTQTVDNVKVGWNEIELTTPYTLTTDSVFIGIEYKTQDSFYPISALSTGCETGSFYIYGPYGDGDYLWYDESESESLSLQCLLEGDNIPQNLIRMRMPVMNGRYYKDGDEVSGHVYLKNWGKKNVASFEAKFQIDGTDVQTLTFNKPNLGRNDYESGYFEVNLPTNLSAGQHNITSVITSINGEDNVNNSVSPSTTLRVYSKSYERKHVLIDHMTAQWCPYCPSTDRRLVEMKKEYNDIIVISTQASDNLSCEATQEYRRFTSYYPALFYDRFAYAGSTSMSGYYSLCKSQPSLMTLSVSASYEADNNIHIRVQGERNDEFEAVEGIGALTVLLTEDSIDAGQADAEEGYHEHYIHDDVIRAAASDVWGDIIQWSGNTFDMSFIVPYDSQWNLSNMHVVAFASRRYSGNLGDINVFNSDISSITQNTTGISTIRNTDNNEPIAIYDTMGRRIDKLVKGVNILRYANGTSKKVIVK